MAETIISVLLVVAFAFQTFNIPRVSGWTDEFCTVPIPIWKVLSMPNGVLELEIDGVPDGRKLTAEVRQLGSCSESRSLSFNSGGPWAAGAEMNMMKLQSKHDWTTCGAAIDGGCTQPGAWGVQAPEDFVNYPLTALTLDAQARDMPACLIAQDSVTGTYELINAGQAIVVRSQGFSFPPQTIMTTNIDSTLDVSDSPDWTTQRSEATISFALKGKTVIKPKISIVEGWNGSQVQPWRSATEADAWTMRYNPLNISNTVNKKNPRLPFNYSYLQQQSLDKFNIMIKESTFKSIGINDVRDTEVTAAASNFQEDDHTLHCRYGAFPVQSEEEDAFLCSIGEDYFCPDNPFGAMACPLHMRQQSCDSALYPSWIGDGESDHCTAWATFTAKFDSKSIFLHSLQWHALLQRMPHDRSADNMRADKTFRFFSAWW
jgi:hypothetical protein